MKTIALIIGLFLAFGAAAQTFVGEPVGGQQVVIGPDGRHHVISYAGPGAAQGGAVIAPGAYHGQPGYHYPPAYPRYRVPPYGPTSPGMSDAMAAGDAYGRIIQHMRRWASQ